MYNVDILTPHKDPDTHCDGLTNGWEAITDLSIINPYGPTNPTNRDSDNDGAIDGGESNVYPNTPIDIDNDSEVGSGKQTDLDGGEGNGRGGILGDAAG